MVSFQSALFNQFSSFSSRFHAKISLNDNVDLNALSNPQLGNFKLGQNLKETLGVELSPQQSVNKVSDFFDVDAVVENVMKFVGQRIELARAEGATEDELATMFDAARSGVEKGFGQAREQIDALGKLDDDLAGSINQAEQGIYKGIDELQFGSDDVSDDQVVPGSAVNNLQYARVYERNTNKFQFEVTTQEGDKVKITARSDSRFYAESLSVQNENGELNYAAAEESNRSGYSLKVKGDLNEAEMAALEDLMAQVNDLSEEFFSGDISTAFDMAMSLTSDADQIAKFSLNLKQRQVSAYEVGSYSNIPEIANYEAPTLPKGLAEPLGKFAGGVRQAFNTAGEFSQPQDLLKSLFEQMDNQPKLLKLLEPLLAELKA